MSRYNLPDGQNPGVIRKVEVFLIGCADDAHKTGREIIEDLSKPVEFTDGDTSITIETVAKTTGSPRAPPAEAECAGCKRRVLFAEAVFCPADGGPCGGDAWCEPCHNIHIGYLLGDYDMDGAE